MYANSRFKAEVNEWGNVERWIEPGEEISQKDLGVSDDEWQYLCDTGAVVESYPKDLDPAVPPAEYYRDNPDEAPDSGITAESASADVMAAADTGKPLPTEPEGGTSGPQQSGGSGSSDKASETKK